MRFDRAIHGLIRRGIATLFALFVGLSLSLTGAFNSAETDGELIEEVKVAQVRTEHLQRGERARPTKVVIHTHVFSSGDHFALPHPPLATGHCLVNGLRAPLRC